MAAQVDRDRPSPARRQRLRQVVEDAAVLGEAVDADNSLAPGPAAVPEVQQH